MNLICQFCPRVFTNPGALGRHKLHCKSNPNCVKGKRSPKAGQQKGSTPWNKGLRTKPQKVKGTHGGYRKGSGRGIKGWYKGFYCDSSWELAYVIFCLEHGKRICRNTEYRTYLFEGRTRKYLPDFIVDDKLVEIKGFSSEQWKAKSAQNPDVIVLGGNDLQPVFQYVISKYGKDYTNLYSEGTEVGSSHSLENCST